jgi:hypothetical protein
MSIKILKELGDNKYEVEITPAEKPLGFQEVGFAMVHDYVEFTDWTHLQNLNGSTSNVKFWTRMTIPIRDFVKFILPKINSHPYSQEEHLKDRIHTEDDIYWNSEWQKGKYTSPRYKKGDNYPAYAEDNVIIKYWENKERKVAVRLRGETSYTIMTPKMFEMIKDKLQYQ